MIRQQRAPREEGRAREKCFREGDNKPWTFIDKSK
jgi:hypothetical protein